MTIHTTLKLVFYVLVLKAVCVKVQANPSLNLENYITQSHPIQIKHFQEMTVLEKAVKKSKFLAEMHDLGYVQPSKEIEPNQWKKGALIGAAVGTPLTFLVLHSGGSTSICNRSANQDAVQFHECLAMSLGGGLVFAGLGALIGSFVKNRVGTAELRNRVNITCFRLIGMELVLLWQLGWFRKPAC